MPIQPILRDEHPVILARMIPIGRRFEDQNQRWPLGASGRPRRGGRPLRLEVLEGRHLLTGVVAEYPLAAVGGFTTHPSAIALGPDGNLWFTQITGGASDEIGRITPTGTVTEFALPSVNAAPSGITPGPDGNLWFTESGTNMIGRITTAGVITEFAVPTANSGLTSITAGPDGNLWFTEFTGEKIGRITPAGVITEFAIATAGHEPSNITAGPDGSLWFTETSGQIGRITTAGVITEFPLSSQFTTPLGITAGPDGNLWFAEGGTNMIGRITPAGVITEFATPTTNSHPEGIAAGPDGNLYFTEASSNLIGRITTAGVIAEYAIPTTNSLPTGIALASNGDLYFTELMANQIGRFDPFVPTTLATVQRYGYHALPTTLVVSFSAGLDPTTARNAQNYTITGPKGQTIAVKSAVYSAINHTVTLMPRARLNVHLTYQLTVHGTGPAGVTDQNGALLDGAGTGLAGGNSTTNITARNLVIPGHAVQIGTSGQIKVTVLGGVKPSHPAKVVAHR